MERFEASYSTYVSQSDSTRRGYRTPVLLATPKRKKKVSSRITDPGAQSPRRENKGRGGRTGEAKNLQYAHRYGPALQRLCTARTSFHLKMKGASPRQDLAGDPAAGGKCLPRTQYHSSLPRARRGQKGDNCRKSHLIPQKG